MALAAENLAAMIGVIVGATMRLSKPSASGLAFPLWGESISDPLVVSEAKRAISVAGSKPEMDGLVNRNLGDQWRLKQEFAGDPVTCCRNSEAERMVRVALSEGHFQRVPFDAALAVWAYSSACDRSFGLRNIRTQRAAAE